MKLSPVIWKPLLVVILVLAAIVYFLTNLESIKALRIASWYYLALMAFGVFGSLVVNGIFNKLILREFSISLRFIEWFGLSVITTSGNLLLPMRGGTVANAIYLKNHHQFPMSDFLATIMGTYVITFFCNAALGLLGMLYLYFAKGIVSWLIGACLLAVTLILGAFIIWDLTSYLKVLRFPKLDLYLNVLMAWNKIRGNGRVIATVVIITVVNLFLASLSTYAGFATIGHPIGFAEALLLAVVAGFSTMLSVLPANMGIREVMTGISSTLLGLTSVYAIMMSLGERILTLTIATISSLCCLPFLKPQKGSQEGFSESVRPNLQGE